MPEGPEVALQADWLNMKIFGRPTRWPAPRISLAILSGRYAKFPMTAPDAWISHTATAAESYGKLAWIKCESDSLVFTFGMTGQFSDVKTQHSRLQLEFSGESGVTTRVYWSDIRNFGTVRWMTNDTLAKKLRLLGPRAIKMTGHEPVPVRATLFAENCRKYHPNRTICEAMLDQRCAAGIGNYIKSEALYLAGASPTSPVWQLSDELLRLIFICAVSIADTSYAAGGATLSTYRSPTGRPGTYQDQLRVYGRALTPKGERVTKSLTPDGRATWWVKPEDRVA